MPAPASSPIHSAVTQLARTVETRRLAGQGLPAAWEQVTDPRKRRGVRHRITPILGLAVCAVLAGCRSFAAIGQWATNASDQVLSALQVGTYPPSESTIPRTLQRLNGDAVDAAIGAWAAAATQPPAGTRQAVAIDGKTVRGSGGGPRTRGICWPRSTTVAGWCSARSTWPARRMRSRCFPRCVTPSPIWPVWW